MSDTDGMPVLRARGLRKEYGRGAALVRAVDGVDLDVAAGQTLAVMGPSGCGKSTLLHLLGGLDRPSAGEIWLNGQRVDQLSERALARLRRNAIGFVFQAFHLMDELTAVENVELPALLAGRSPRAARRQAGRDMRRRPGQAAALLLAITAATATLTLGLALHGVTSQPYQQTRSATSGPDVVARLSGPVTPPGRLAAADPARQIQAQVKALVHAPGVTGSSGPYPVASAILRIHGTAVPVEAEGRDQAQARLDQPKLTAGSWVSEGSVVLERTFAEALGAGVGDRVTISGRPFRVAGIAVTAAGPPYPNLCYSPGGGCVFDLPGRLSPDDIGFAWVTEPDARALASAAAPLSYFLNLKLSDQGDAQAFASAYDNAHQASSAATLNSWESISAADALLVQGEQQVLTPGAWLLGLLAVASVAVLVGGRMAEQTRRVGLLKAVGGTPGLVTALLLAQNLVLALAAAVAGLAAGWLAAPLLTSPGAALIGTPGAPTLTAADVVLVVAVALAVALAATLVPAIRATRTSTVSALSAVPGSTGDRRPRRRAALIAISARLPVPLLLGLRLVARRPRRAALSAASIAVTAAGIVAVLAFHATADERSSGLANPQVSRDEQVLIVITVMLLTLAALNALFTAWATVSDARRSSALARALGASPWQVSSGLAAAQLLPALPGAIAGVPAGIGLFAVANGAGLVTVPPASWLAAAVLGTLLAVVGLTAIPARLGARRPAGEILQAETS